MWIFPVPPSLNRMYKSWRGRMVKSAEAKAYQKLLGDMLASQVPTEKDVKISIKVYRPRKAGDLDNYLKTFLDSLTGYLYVDDKQIQMIVAERFDDKDNPRVELLLNEL
jgi:crossover junction endodeoxyribonuclease RusA